MTLKQKKNDFDCFIFGALPYPDKFSTSDQRINVASTLWINAQITLIRR